MYFSWSFSDNRDKLLKLIPLRRLTRDKQEFSFLGLGPQQDGDQLTLSPQNSRVSSQG